MLFILLCGAYLTVKTGFVQFRAHRLMGRCRMKAVTAALAASLGTGNITGCAAAIAVGGRGAVFWMWVSAFLGMATAYAENFLGARLKACHKGSSFGPMLYMEKAFGRFGKSLALVYAFSLMASGLAMGCMAQSGAFSAAVCEMTGASRFVPLILSILTAAVLFSGKKGFETVMNVTEKAVVPMGVFYLIGASVTLILVRADIVEALMGIVTDAFSPAAFSGGAVGTAVSVGLRRGVFSNEAGMGSSVIVHSGAGFHSPESAGAWACFEVFLDTIVCCTLTALVIICTGASCTCSGIGSAVSAAFSAGMGCPGRGFACVSVCLFAFAAVLGWSCYGGMCADYVSERLWDGDPSAERVYALLCCAAVFVGGIVPEEISLALADLANCFVMLPNLVAVMYIYLTEKRLDVKCRVRYNKNNTGYLLRRDNE